MNDHSLSPRLCTAKKIASPSKRLIIDCDPGNGVPGANVDDGIALALALASPELTVDMITTVAGNTPSAIGWQVAMSLLNAVGLTLPVYQGATQALAEPAEPWRHLLDRRAHADIVNTLWHNTPQPLDFGRPTENAVEAMAHHICRHPGEITLVALGPLTNVALALHHYPDMAHCVRDIVIMGGTFDVAGYLKDTNVGMDPEALHVVLHSGAPLTLVPLDVTTKTMLMPEDMRRFTEIDTPLARYLATTVAPWLAYSMSERRLPGCWLHDVLTVAWLLDREVATADTFRVGIELREGPTRGRTWRYKPPLNATVGIPEHTGCLTTVLTQVNNKRLIDLIMQAVSTPVPFQHQPVH